MSPGNPSSDDLSHPIRTFERVQQKQASSQLEGGMRVRTDRPWDIMFFSEPARLTVEGRQ